MLIGVANFFRLTGAICASIVATGAAGAVLWRLGLGNVYTWIARHRRADHIAEIKAVVQEAMHPLEEAVQTLHDCLDDVHSVVLPEGQPDLGARVGNIERVLEISSLDLPASTHDHRHRRSST